MLHEPFKQNVGWRLTQGLSLCRRHARCDWLLWRRRWCLGLCFYLEDVALCELERAGGDVNALARLNLNAVHTLVAVAVVHRVVGRQEDPLAVGDRRATLGCGEQTEKRERKSQTHGGTNAQSEGCATHEELS